MRSTPEAAVSSSICRPTIRAGRVRSRHITPNGFAATLTGEGTLSAYLNGELLGTLSGTGTLSFRSNLAANDLVLRYEGTGMATLAQFDRQSGMAFKFR